MINQDEFSQIKSDSSRGKHRIYIGMAPGVGKTYRMLQEARLLKEEGIDIVIGVLETHGRQETAEQAEGLEKVPLQEINYRGKILPEMNLEGILARQPQIVLIDELAHTNLPGLKHEKRYQDVEEVLLAGIDVYSTVNIQHLESLKDLIIKMTGVSVRERIPDRILDSADEIMLVDVTPEILQQRLEEGKIYALDKIAQSLTNFFQYRNLIALRELALREIADNLEEKVHLLPDSNRFRGVQERILVSISTYPHSSRLLRRGARLATQMKGKLYVVFVADPDRFLTKDETVYIEMCQQLCQGLGGEFIRISSSNVVKAIADTAHKYHITQIVLGQTKKSRWELFFQGSIVQNLMRHLQDVDLHIISTKTEFNFKYE